MKISKFSTIKIYSPQVLAIFIVRIFYWVRLFPFFPASSSNVHTIQACIPIHTFSSGGITGSFSKRTSPCSCFSFHGSTRKCSTGYSFSASCALSKGLKPSQILTLQLWRSLLQSRPDSPLSFYPVCNPSIQSLLLLPYLLVLVYWTPTLLQRPCRSTWPPFGSLVVSPVRLLFEWTVSLVRLLLRSLEICPTVGISFLTILSRAVVTYVTVYLLP